MRIGKKIRLANGRRLVTDIVEMAAKMPLAPLVQEVDLSELECLRKQIRPKLNWTVIVMRAYALVAQEFPELKQMYATFPWPHIYQHYENVCMNTITREHDGETRLFFSRFHSPENFSFHQLQEQFEHFRRSPVQSVRQFRSQIRFAKIPRMLRKFLWWFVFNVVPHKRASHMGTFGLSLSGFGDTKGSFHLGPSTTTLGYELFPKNGQMRLTLTFDHRIIDGKPATEIVDKLTKVLLGRVKWELNQLVEQTQERRAA